MSLARPSAMLRRVLLADALISGAAGLLMVLGSGWLANLFALPEGLLRSAGLLLLPFAAGVAFVATRERLSSAAVRAVIVANLLWVAGSLALLAGPVAPTVLGLAFVVAQALAVAVLAVLQYLGVRDDSAPV